ncbi:MAG TPA: hypothetical protein VHI53_01450 [Gaiellaceae bacterium]|jgi:hypothetical protein|nr:hypothetical protein [Gaiellaceae bacterium]
MHRGAVTALAFAFVALLAATGPSAAPHATLSLVSRHPVALHGRGFASHERVQVVVRAGVTVSREVRADASGAFTTRFVRVDIPRCGGVFAHARGSSGTLAALKIPLPACMPVSQP